MTLLHVLGAIGLVFVVSLGNIAEPIRALWKRRFRGKLGDLLPCPQCFGVWAGAAWATLIVLRPRLPPIVGTIHDVLAFAFTVSLFGFVGAVLEAFCIWMQKGTNAPHFFFAQSRVAEADGSKREDASDHR